MPVFHRNVNGVSDTVTHSSTAINRRDVSNVKTNTRSHQKLYQIIGIPCDMRFVCWCAN